MFIVFKMTFTNGWYFRFYTKCFRFPQKSFVAFYTLFFILSLSLSLLFRFYITTQASTNHSYKQITKKANKSTHTHTQAHTFAFAFIFICIEWRLLIRYCTVDLRKLNKMIWNFDLQESRMTTFSLVVLPIFWRKKYISIYLPVRNAHCLRIDFRRIWTEASIRNNTRKR